MSEQITWTEALQQLEFHKQVKGWREIIAGQLRDNNMLYEFLVQLPWPMRRNMYTFLRPCLGWEPAPWYMYASKFPRGNGQA